MNFGNNIERLGFEKSGWVIVDQSADGKVVYMGKPSTADAKPADAAWHIRKVTTEVQDDGSVLTMIQHAEPSGKCSWSERKDLEYLPVLKDIRKAIVVNLDEYGYANRQECYFEPGMTWREWVESEYNVYSYTIQPVTSMTGDKFDGVICNTGNRWCAKADEIISDDDVEYFINDDYTGMPGFGGGGW